MRLHVYAEEITTETELVTKEVNDAEFGKRTFYGIRLFLKSPSDLHHSPEDDDRSAVTFWVPWTRAGGHAFDVMDDLLAGLAYQLQCAIEQDTLEAQGA